MKIKLKLSASVAEKTESVTIEELGFTSVEWKKLSEEERNLEVFNFICNLPDQPYWEIDSQEEVA